MEILGVRHHQFMDSRSISLSVDSPSRMMISLSATIRPNWSVWVLDLGKIRYGDWHQLARSVNSALNLRY